MTDLWGFLLQTLTVSGAAALLLAVKAVFRDKLSPRWQAAAWGVLGLVLLVPAGWGGRYVLINWPWLVETAKTLLTGTYTLTAVSAPIPLPPAAAPRTWADWLYLLYLAGVLALLGRYLVSYIRLRAALRRGQPAGEARTAQIAAAAERYGETLLVRELLPYCPEAAAALSDKLGCREASFGTAGGTQPFGMANSLDGTPLPQRAYLGPAFE